MSSPIIIPKDIKCDEAIDNKPDFLVIGRPISNSKNPLKFMKEF